MNQQPKVFTASEIAAGLGIARPTVHDHLSGIAPDGERLVHGNTAQAWSLAILPVQLQQRINAAAVSLGYRNAEQLLADPQRLADNEASDEVAEKVTPDQFGELRRVIEKSHRPLSKAQKVQILNLSLERYAALVDLGHSSKSVKTALCALLWDAGLELAASRNALRMLFARKHAQWVMAGRKVNALADRRAGANRDRSLKVGEEDRDIVIGHSVIGCGGRVSQGWRECVQNGWLSQELQARFLSNPASKSHVPNSVREAVRYEVATLEANHHGPRGTRDNGAYIERYWGSVPAMAWYCMDDATLPIYFYVPDGNGWFTLMRGQFLLAIDTRSTCILGYALMPERNYNARVIRSLITKVCDDYGLPRKGFYLERGIWENSRILKGASSDDVPLEWAEVQQGLTGFGLVFKHAIRARSKPVERVIGAIQNLMEGYPGYAGRDEIHEKFEHFQKMKLRVDRRDLDPRGTFYSHEQWDHRLHELCERYNSEPQQGKMTMGLSPEDAMERFKDHSDQPVHFDARCRYLLANDRRPILVTKNGITLRYGKQVFNYRSENTGPLRGKTVIAWFDPDAPEILAVTDMNRENAFCVARSQQVPALDSPEDILAQEMQRVEDHMRHARTRYKIIKAKHDQKFRPLALGRDTIELGQQIATGRAAVAAEQGEKAQLQSRARKVYGAMGLALPNGGNPRPEQVEAAEQLRKLLNQEPL